ncbi:MAG: nucleoside triphosphate pyrophosphohydrolase [Lentisphaerae bacterium GWF2_44_16]|nr:MAG: nucleoside triphosphate pyrophosphohydrolase [Lentisphaerae bacterium GWF2_44_16]
MKQKKGILPVKKKSSGKDWVKKLVEVISVLRGPGGCPWDREQTHKTLKPYLIEECAELMDAVDDNDSDSVCEELGDVLMHIIMSSKIASEKGHFDFNEVAKRSVEKMIRRHPHVFGEQKAATSGEVLDIWEDVKKKEKKRQVSSVMDGIPRHFPALLRATKVQKKAAKYGFDWSSEEQIIRKIEEELEEVKKAHSERDSAAVDEEIGDLLFAVVNLCRFRKSISAEELLASAVKKFQNRFRYIEKQLALKGKTLEQSSLDEMEKLWEKAKKKERIK